MLLKNKKEQKRLAKLILASLLVSGWSVAMPSMASATAIDPDTTFNFHASPSAVTIDASVADSEGIKGFTGSDPVAVYGNIEANNYRHNFGSGALVTSNYTGKILSMASYGTNDYSTSNLIQMVNDETFGPTGAVSGYTVTLNAPSDAAIHDVIGGFALGGTATGNTVNINGGSIGHAAGGWNVSADTGGASGNTLNISSGFVSGAFGGFGGMGGSATGNTLNLNGGEVSEAIGGSGGIESSSNTINISGGEVSMFIHGGNSGWAGGIGPADNNTVNITGGSMFNEYSTATIYGGSGGTSASGNAVTIGGTAKLGADTNIYGGVASYQEVDPADPYPETPTMYVTKEGTAANNTVNILIPMTVAGLYGGIGDTATSTGNTLNVAAKNVVTGDLNGFQNMNFFLPPDIANGDTMLTVNGGSPTDVQGVTFGVAALQGATLAEGNTVDLVTNPNGLTTDGSLQTTTSFTVPTGLTTDTTYEMSISKKDGNTIMATVDKATPKPSPDADERLKSPVETMAGVVTMINSGTDMMASQGMDNAAAAVAAAGGQSAPFAALGGSSLRAQSGSHVDTKGFNIGLGFAKEIENNSGKLLIGPIVEYGHGKYDSYQDNGITADGKSHYWGIGLIAKQTNNNGFYYEGSLRVGQAKSDYNSDQGAFRANYDSKSTFWAAHLGLGKLVDIGKNNTLDYYGKYFYSHTGGDDVTMHTTLGDVAANFDSVDSNRLRIGARITHAMNEKNKIYGGLAYQYEFSGNARATFNGTAAPSPSVKGSSGMMELGWQVKPGKSPMVIDLGVTGWVGKQRGVTANLQATWTF